MHRTLWRQFIFFNIVRAHVLLRKLSSMKTYPRQMRGLEHVDRKPNVNLKEVKCEIYKISITLPPTGDLNCKNYNLCYYNTWISAPESGYGEPEKFHGTNHQVLYENADRNINMGVFFNDIDEAEKSWYQNLYIQMGEMKKDPNFITIDESLRTFSCYVELHRKG